MIYTCTLNPAVDYKIKIDQFVEGKLNRIEEAEFSAGGKGINVSIVLNNLETKNIATGFLGGFPGIYIKEYLEEKYQLNMNFIEIKEPTRINVKLKQIKSETEINHQGPNVEEHDFNALLSLINSLKQDDILICGGSSCKGIHNSYQKIALLCNEKRIKFVMDTPGIYLSQFISFSPFLIKPNNHELEEYFKVKIKTINDTIYYGKKLIEQGAQNVIISLGAKGSVFINKDVIYRSNMIKGLVTNTVGAGDSMVAGFMHQYLKTNDYKKAYEYAIASGTATAFNKGLANLESINKYIDKVRVKEIL
jgi:1-phosphofructokinase